MAQWFRIHAVSAEDQSSIPNMLVRQLTTKAPGGSSASVLNRHLHTGAHTQNTHTRNLKSKYFFKKKENLDLDYSHVLCMVYLHISVNYILSLSA